MKLILLSIIFLAGLFVLGCSEDIVYNGITGDNSGEIKKDSEVKRRFVTHRATAPVGSTADVADEIFVGINRIRLKHQEKKLLRSAELDRAAQTYSKAMARNGAISHVDEKGRQLEDRLEVSGITAWSQAGENLASSTAGADPGQSALWGWQQSPEHLENLLFPTFTETGIGVYRDPASGEYFITQLFITPN